MEALSISDKYESINFSQLKENDFHQLFVWLNQPYIRTFYQKEAIDFIAIEQKYTERLQSNSTVNCYIINFNTVPIGYIQTYMIADHVDFSNVTGVKNGASIDFYIGNPAFLNRGFGWLIELKFLKEILFSNTTASKCYVYHEKDNIPALKSSKKVGFRYFKSLIIDNKVNYLFLIPKIKLLEKAEVLLKS